MSYNDFIPNAFQIPNAFVDQILKHLHEAEIKVYLFIVRKTLGWHKEFDNISLSQFKIALDVKDDRTIQSALNKLLDKDLIIKKEQAGYPSKFAINLNPKPLHIKEGGHIDVLPTNVCIEPLHDNEGRVPTCACTPQKTIKNTSSKTTLSACKRETFQEFKSKLLETCPEFVFKLPYPNKLKYRQDHLGFIIQGGLIFDYHNDRILNKDESFQVWLILYKMKERVFELAQAQLAKEPS